MPRPKNPIPAYRLHRQSGQAIVTVNVNGTRKDMLLASLSSARIDQIICLLLPYS